MELQTQADKGIGIVAPSSAKTLVPPSQNPPQGGIENNSITKVIESALAKQVIASLDTAIDSRTFPNQPRPGLSLVPASIGNVEHMLKGYGITVSYNVISKKLVITIPGYSGSPDNADETAMAHILSIANLNSLPIGQIHSFVAVIADSNLVNPVADWITSKPWDGEDRLEKFYSTLQQRDGYPVTLKKTLMYRWLISAVAAALKPTGFKARGVLTLQGPQGIGKTSWISALVSDPLLREKVIKLDHHLDAGNKDSLLTAISHWIVELGELDSSFKKDVARLKGFLTSDRDRVRRPYGRTDSEYARKTVFCASVNEDSFLVDTTGNSRWWTIPVTNIHFNHGIDMQQLFAQVAVEFSKGAIWWLSAAEEAELNSYNKQHQSVSVIRERILNAIDHDRIGTEQLPAFTASDVLRELGIQSPTNSQAKEAAAVLRDVLGEYKRITGLNKWRVPLKHSGLLLPPRGHATSPAKLF